MLIRHGAIFNINYLLGYSDAKTNVVFEYIAGGTQLNLPQFPQTRELKLPASLPADRLNTFLAMYRVHSLQLYRLILSQVPTSPSPLC
jgi:hypothetical protein